MDMKSKGFRWVENICNKFESICEDVDDTIHMDPVKYVGNPVQVVSKGVKKAYSVFKQDSLSTEVNLGKSHLPTESCGESDFIEGYIEAVNMAGHELYVSAEQPTAVCSSKLDRVNGLNLVQSCSAIEGHESDSEEIVSDHKSVDNGVTVVSTQDEVSQSKNVEVGTSGPPVTNSVLKEYINEQSACLKSPASDHDYELILPVQSSIERSLLESITQGVGNLSIKPSKDDASLSCKSRGLPAVSTNGIVSESVEKSVQKELSKKVNSEGSSVFDSTDMDSYKLSGSETSSCSSGSTVEQGWESSPLRSSLTFSDICITDDTCIDSAKFSDETVSSGEMKFSQCDMLIDRHVLHPSSQSGRNQRSYKKLLQDTINSRRRRVKEYKQLGIWYGDIHDEVECSSQSTPKHKSPNNTVKLSDSELIVTTPKQDISEWEVL